MLRSVPQYYTRISEGNYYRSSDEPRWTALRKTPQNMKGDESSVDVRSDRDHKSLYRSPYHERRHSTTPRGDPHYWLRRPILSELVPDAGDIVFALLGLASGACMGNDDESSRIYRDESSSSFSTHKTGFWEDSSPTTFAAATLPHGLATYAYYLSRGGDKYREWFSGNRRPCCYSHGDSDGT